MTFLAMISSAPWRSEQEKLALRLSCVDPLRRSKDYAFSGRNCIHENRHRAIPAAERNRADMALFGNHELKLLAHHRFGCARLDVDATHREARLHPSEQTIDDLARPIEKLETRFDAALEL